jgi:hypothetical protein
MTVQPPQHKPSNQYTLKRFILFLVISANASGVFAQHLVIPNKPYANLGSSPGYITINEFTAGIGFKEASVPFSKSFFGFNTIHGYQISRNFVVGAGTGISIYNGGAMIPFFIDFRFYYSIHSLTPFFSGDGGLLFNPSGNEKLFINPGAGIRYALNKNMCITLGSGFFLQVAETLNSFVNFKIGLTFKPNR